MKVSIIIPVYNRVDFTQKCIESIFRYESKFTFEIIVVDNASHDGTKEYVESISKKIQSLRNEENRGFAKACNQGATKANGEYLLFLNNDTIVTKNWMDVLVDALDADQKIAIAGSKLLYPNGEIQHAGIVFNNDKVPYHIYRRERGEQLFVNKKRKFQAVTGACLMIRKNIFLDVSGFDEIYLNGFEDIDLCLKVGKLGFDVIYCPESVVYHYESVSAGRVKHDDKNQEIFFARWKDEIRVDDMDFMIADETIGQFGRIIKMQEKITFLQNDLDYANRLILQQKKIINVLENENSLLKRSFFGKIRSHVAKLIRMAKLFFVVWHREGVSKALSKSICKLKK